MTVECPETLEIYIYIFSDALFIYWYMVSKIW